MKRIFLKVLSLISKRIEIDFLGSKYGGWYFVNRLSLSNSWVISCGVGTDISFDIELMQKYQTKTLFIDPTPEAISHMNSVMNSLGSVKKESYNQHGKQNIAIKHFTNIKYGKQDYNLIILNLITSNHMGLKKITLNW